MAAYYEFIIKGDDRIARAYLEGFFVGKGIRSGYAFSEDHPVSLSHIKELIKYHGDVLHVVVEGGLRAMVTSAIKQSGDLDFDIAESHKIERAFFCFEFRTANRKVAGQIKRTVDNLPDGVRLIDSEHEEVVHPDASGTEGYAPLHEYEFSGKGSIEGDPIGVRAMHERMRDREHFEVDDIGLRLA